MAVHCIPELFDGYLYFPAKGSEDNKADMINYSRFIFDTCVKNKCKTMILDHRELQSSLGIVEMLETVDDLIKRGILQIRPRMACLVTKDNFVHNERFEIVAQNRSFDYKMFLDKDEAVAWVKASS